MKCSSLISALLLASVSEAEKDIPTLSFNWTLGPFDGALTYFPHIALPSPHNAEAVWTEEIHSAKSGATSHPIQAGSAMRVGIIPANSTESITMQMAYPAKAVYMQCVSNGSVEHRFEPGAKIQDEPPPYPGRPRPDSTARPFTASWAFGDYANRTVEMTLGGANSNGGEMIVENVAVTAEIRTEAYV